MSGADIPDLPHFLAHAHAMEVEAAERYRLFAGQMKVYNNPEIADLFARRAEPDDPVSRFNVALDGERRAF